MNKRKHCNDWCCVTKAQTFQWRENTLSQTETRIFASFAFVSNVCEISHTSIKVIIISLICCAGWFYAEGRRLFFTANQTAAHQQPGRHTHALNQTTEPRAHVFVRRAQRSRTITESQQLKSQCHKSQGRPPRNINMHRNSDRSYLLLEWLAELSEPEQTKTKTFEMHVSNQPSRLNWPIP